MKIRNVTTKILLASIGVTLPLAVCLMLVMAYFMNSLTDSIMLGTLQPMARTAAQNVENRLHTMAERFFILRESRVLRDTGTSVEEKQDTLDSITAGREYAWLGLYELDGVLLTGSDASPRTITGRDLFPLLLQTSNLVVEKTTIGASGPEVAMGVPVIAGYGPEDRTEPAYYLVGGYTYDTLSDVLRDVNIGARGTAFIIDQNGYIIAHKNLGKVFSQEAVLHSLGGGSEAEAVFTAMTNRQTGSARIHASNEDIFVGFSPIKGTLWSLGIQAPRDDFMTSAQQALFIGTLLIAAALLATVLFVGFFNRRVLSVPLAAIAANARELAGGNFSGGLPASLVGREDEIGQLGAAFDSMSASVRSLIGDIRGMTIATGIGDLGARTNPETYSGDFRRIVESLNASLDGVCSYLDGMPDALLLFNEKREPMYHNRAMSQILARHGLREDDPALFSSLWAHEGDDAAEEAAGEAAGKAVSLFEPDAPVSAEFECQTNLADTQGQKHSYTASLSRIRGPIHTLCVMLILNDVTALARARTQAEAASHAKGDFLSRMSHEMRTPMNAIIGMANIGLGAHETERKQYCLNKIAGASQHLLGVINDILDMSKIEADKFELSVSPFDVAVMLQRVVDVIRFQTDEKGQELAVHIDPLLPACCMGDEQRLAQVVTNLLGNAAKFTPSGGAITLRAQLAEQIDSHCSIRISVSDTGIGMTGEQRDRLFRPFEQADGSISRKYGGTGLGLAISKRIVEKMDGLITLESSPGKGSTFTVEVPMPVGRQEEAAARADMPPAAGPAREAGYAPGIFRGRRVLLAEDVDINREIVSSLLEHTGLEMIFACDGEEAVQTFYADPQRFDLILMDVQMPQVNGYEATARIRASGLPDSETIPIIAMTANVFREDIERCLKAGMNGHLGKPINADEVIATLSRQFESRNALSA